MLAKEAIKQVGIKRPAVGPNLGFREQLATYEQQLGKGVKEKLSNH